VCKTLKVAETVRDRDDHHTCSHATCKSHSCHCRFEHCTDTKKGPLKKNPKEDYEPVDRLRRMLLDDVENNVSFFMVGFLYTLLGVGCENAMKSYTYLSFARYVAHLTGQNMQVRAILWVLMSLSFMTICIQMMAFVLRYGTFNVADEDPINHSTL
jgi:hypothetical protein